MIRYIFVTGGVLSSLGKGLAAASLAALLQARGYKVRLRKFEPYLNVDPGTMSPYQHGEVYVTEDGAETDLDLGHYERFTGVSCRQSDAVTTGRIYSDVIARERRGDYLGATVQVIPHITDAIKDCIRADLEPDLDFLICEVGGTVGDIESLPYLEAFRQFSNEEGSQRTLFIHLTLVPYIASAGELKTKPSQHSVKELLHLGIQPDILLCRCDRPIPQEAKYKLALFCNIKPECVIEALDVDTIYQVPICYSDAGLDIQVLRHFDLDAQNKPALHRWHSIVDCLHHPRQEVTIAVVGKYVALRDAYKSLIEALSHGGISQDVRVNIDWVDAEELEQTESEDAVLPAEKILKRLRNAHGILVPGGYGVRGTEGMIGAIRYAREHKVPYLGICFGMQLAMIEVARSLLDLKEASSTEFGSTPCPIVGLLTEWRKGEAYERRVAGGNLGGTMRLGSYECHLETNTLAHSIYGQKVICERHRHRYEVNIDYRPQFEKLGMIFSGLSPDGILPEMVELRDHPWFLGMQFHPELKSRPFEPHPVFKAFIAAAVKRGEETRHMRDTE
ncbi:MAG: CTP synthase [Caedimonas sp.]|nr:CTP synthase [Caedimonas sp.]